jgi:BMFP domain-containing protein YqiC
VLVALREVDRNVSQEGAEAQGGPDAARHELEQLRERMAVIKQEAAADVDRKWGSPFRTQEVFDLKVKARLSGNDEYRSLQGRVRETEARLAAQSDTASEADSAR